MVCGGKAASVLLIFSLCMAFAFGARQAPKFSKQIIDPNLVGNYWVQTFDMNNDSFDDLVAIVYGAGLLVWYENPGARNHNHSAPWTQHLIAKLPLIVAIDFGYLDDNDLVDIVVAYNFTIPSEMGEQSYGMAAWLQNTGSPYTPFTVHNIQAIPALHRLLWLPHAGSYGAIIAAPLFGMVPNPPTYLSGHCNVTLLVRDMASGQLQWVPRSIINNIPPLDLIHTFLHLPRTLRPGYSSIMLGSMQGLSALHIQDDLASFELVHLADGSPKFKYSPYTGVQGAAICPLTKQNASYFGYIPTTGPWEGANILTPPTIQVALPTVQKTQLRGLFTAPLNQTILEILGPQGHVTVCGDFQNDGISDFLVGLRGPVKDIVYFFPTDETLTTFQAVPLSFDDNLGASGLATGDFDKDGNLDFAATGFPGFGEPKFGDHYLGVFWNENAS